MQPPGFKPMQGSHSRLLQPVALITEPNLTATNLYRPFLPSTYPGSIYSCHVPSEPEIISLPRRSHTRVSKWIWTSLFIPYQSLRSSAYGIWNPCSKVYNLSIPYNTHIWNWPELTANGTLNCCKAQNCYNWLNWPNTELFHIIFTFYNCVSEHWALMLLLLDIRN